MRTFELILEFNRPTAAIVCQPISSNELDTLYALLPPESLSQPGLSERWNARLVICPPDWAREQLRRVPMFKPKGIHFSFADDPATVKSRESVSALDTAFKVIKAVQSHFCVQLEELEGPSRQWSIVWPRWCAIALVKQHTSMSFPKIGLIFNRSHGAIIHAVNSLNDHIQTSREAAAQFQQLQQTVAKLLGVPIAA
jgi:hypothetical protein